MKSLADIHRATATLPPRILIHGLEGVGKTTLAARFPSPVFLQIEDGTGNLELATFGLLDSLAAAQEAITALGNEDHDFRTLVLDSIDALEPLIWAAICRERGWPSIEAPGYGKGYVEADASWRDLLAGLDWLRRTRDMLIILIAHSAVETVNDPRVPAYTSYQLRVHKRARGPLQDWADVIGFLGTDVVIKSEDAGFGKKRIRADGGSTRYLHFEGRPAFTAKNRYGLPAKMPVPLDFEFASKLAPFFPSAAPAGAVLIRAAGGGP
jgi:AAA domain